MPKGSGSTAMSVRKPLSMRKCVPSPPWVSPTTQASTRSPRSFTPARRTASAAPIMAATPPFMFCTPWPYNRSPSTSGVHGSRLPPRVRELISMWPLNMRLGPPPAPLRAAMVWYRPGATSCSVTS